MIYLLATHSFHHRVNVGHYTVVGSWARRELCNGCKHDGAEQIHTNTNVYNAIQEFSIIHLQADMDLAATILSLSLNNSISTCGIINAESIECWLYALSVGLAISVGLYSSWGCCADF